MFVVTILRTGESKFEWAVRCQYYSVKGVSETKDDAWQCVMTNGDQTWSDNDRAWSNKPCAPKRESGPLVKFKNNRGEIKQQDVGKDCYMFDDDTVTLQTDLGPKVGKVVSVVFSGVYVRADPVGYGL